MPEDHSTFPLTQSQLRFWHGSQLAPHDPSYAMIWRFDLYQNIDPARFARALSSVVAQNDALHARFHMNNDAPVQSRATEPFELPAYLDLSGEPDDALEAHLTEWQSQPFKSPLKFPQDKARPTVRNAPNHPVPHALIYRPMRPPVF